MGKKMLSKEDLLARTRQKMAERSQGRKDPDEFRCPLAKPDETLEFYFKVLPPLEKGDKSKAGICELGMPNGLWYYENGSHFHNKQRHECPRIHDNAECELCQFGFDLMSDSQEKEFKQKIARKYLARSYYAVNIYFPNTSKNPEALRGQVMWYNAPRTIWDKWDACIQSDDSGDPEEPRACGIFFHPWEATYAFKLIATRKGDYNTYETSQFIPATFGPLVKTKDDQPDDEAIEKILDQRHYLPDKFAKRDPKKIAEVLAAFEEKEGGTTGTDKINVGPRQDAAEDDGVENLVEPAPPASPAPPRKKQESKKVVEEALDESDMPGEQESGEDMAGTTSEGSEEIDETPKAKVIKPGAPVSKTTKRQEVKKPEVKSDDEAELSNLLQALDE